MHIATIPNRGQPALLLRESYREAGKTKNRTLANLSAGPPSASSNSAPCCAATNCCPPPKAVEIVRALPHGHVLAALGTARRIALDDLLPRRAPQRRRDLALALIVARLLEPAAKLATARMLDPPPPAIRWARCWGSAGRRQGGLCRARLAGPRAALHRSQAGPPPPEGWRAAALRRHLHLSRRTLLRTGAAWLQPRPPGRPAANCHRPDVRGRRLPGRGRGVRRQHRRSGDAGGADRQAEAALPAAARGDGRRPRPADQRADRADAAPGRSRLDHRAAGSGDQAARRRRRAVAALAVR